MTKRLEKKALRSKEQGAVLVIGLIVLLALTILGTSSMTSVQIEEKLSANDQDYGMAFEGAEAGLANCEAFIQANTLEQIDQLAIDLNALASPENPRWWQAFDWANGADVNTAVSFVDTANGKPGLSGEPACVMEFIGAASPSLEFGEAVATEAVSTKNLYRITAFSNGITQRSSAILESVYAK